MLRIITDFDGPIIDVSPRYYRVYQICLEKHRRPQQQIKKLSLDQFWLQKRQHIPEIEIGIASGLDEIQAKAFAKLRKEIVHTHPYFQLDTLKPGVIDTLLKIQKAGFDLAVMTMRRHSELEYALETHNLGKFFPENRRFCLSDDYVKTRDVEDKPLLMRNSLSTLPTAQDTWMIGDTEADIAAAKKHNIKVIGIECGIRDRNQLEMYSPDFIVQDFNQAVDFIISKHHKVL
ncbi:MAG: HAD family hydrolase [Cyanobacteria bacterium P01_A01_bin.45]